MKFIFFALLALTVQAQAAVDPGVLKSTLEAQPSCQNFVRHDDTYLYLGFGAYMRGAEKIREPLPAKVEVASFTDIEFRRTLETLDGAVDAVSTGDRLFILTYSALEEWSLSTWTRVATHETYMNGAPKRYREHATAMRLFGQTLVISHGRLGVSFFDIAKNRLADQQRLLTRQLPLESQAVGVAKWGDKAVILVDGFSLVKEGSRSPFAGLVVVDPSTRQVVRELTGPTVGAETLSIHDQQLLIGGLGMVSRHPAADLNSTSITADANPLRKWEGDGFPYGRAEYDGKYLYTCFQRPPAPGEGRIYRRVPRALPL